LVIFPREKMTWVFVNFFNNRDVETFDVNATEQKKRKQQFFNVFWLLGNLVSYVPTGIHILSYLLRNKNESQ